MFAYTATATRLRPLGERLGLLAPPGEPTSGQPAGPYDCRDTRHRDARIFNGFGKVDSLAYLAQIRERTGIAISPTPCCPGTFSTRSTRTARGQRKIAGAMAPFLEPVLRRRIAEVLAPSTPH